MVLSAYTPFDKAARGVLAQSPPEGFSGDLGNPIPLIPIIIGGGAFILGGGTLWHLHERHTEKEAYQSCLDKFTTSPYNMPAEEAARACKGEVKPKGFQFGLNAPTFLLIGGSAFGLWFMTQLMIKAAK